MAQKVQVSLVDDLTGGDATETIKFAVDGKAYVIDLNDKNADKLRKAFTPYVEKARRDVAGPAATTGKGSTGRNRSARSDSDAEAVRAWAREQGLPVSARGRISADVREAYAASH